MSALSRAVAAIRVAGASRRAPWAIWIAAALVRGVLGLGLLAPRVAPLGDEVVYTELARTLREQGTLGFASGRATAHRMPGYPMLVAGAQLATGSTLFAPRALQALIGSTTPVAIFLVTRLLLGPGAALLAAVLAVLDPFLVFYDWRLWAEAMTIALTSWTVYTAVRVAPRIDLPAAIGVALLATAALYMRPDSITLGPAIVLWLAFWLRPWRRWLAIAVTMGVVVELLLVPWQLRNLRVTGSFVPLTTEAGYILWQTNNVESMHNSGIKGFWYPWPGNPEANDVSAYLAGPDLAKDPRFAGITSEVDVDRRCKQLVRQFWWENRWDLPAYVLLKWARFFALSPAFSFWKQSFVVVSRIWYGAVLPAFVGGLGLALWRRKPIGIYLSLLAAFFAKAAIVHVNFRYRLQVEPVLLSLAGFAVFALLEALVPAAPSTSASSDHSGV